MSQLEIEHCRVCGVDSLISVLNFGDMFLSGYFPSSIQDDNLKQAPLELVRCTNLEICGLLQLRHSVDPQLSFHQDYGYKTSLNPHMVKHVERVANWVLNMFESKDLNVLEIGSNDGTLINFLDITGQRVAIDPLYFKFRENYNKEVIGIEGFFPQDFEVSNIELSNFEVIISLSMLYDLQDPQEFINSVSRFLNPEKGLWIFEQSYAPIMLRNGSYDTICHEHLEYYSLKPLEFMLDKADLRIIDYKVTKTNGGSLLAAVAPKTATFHPIRRDLSNLRELELRELDSLIQNFEEKVKKQAYLFKSDIENLVNLGKTVGVIGASTKGNTILQFCNLDNNLIKYAGEVNSEKIGRLTPGTWIEIVDENTKQFQDLNYFVVLPWHFREYFLNKHSTPEKLIFPINDTWTYGYDIF